MPADTSFSCGPYKLKLKLVDKSEIKNRTRASESDILSETIRVLKDRASSEQLVLILRELLVCTSYGHHGFLANTHPASEEVMAHSFGAAIVELLANNAPLRAWIDVELKQALKTPRGVRALQRGSRLASTGHILVGRNLVEVKVESLENLWGAFKGGSHPTLWIAPELKGQHRKVIFFHEVFHAFYHFLALGKKSDYESATLQAKALLKLFVDNPGMWEWLSRDVPWPVLEANLSGLPSAKAKDAPLYSF